MKTIPEYGKGFDEVLAELDSFKTEDPDYKAKKTWSLVYFKDEEYTHFLAEASEKYMSANGLNPTAFKSLKKFENDIVAFTAELLHADGEPAGCVTSCGTESCMLAVKTYRDYGRLKKHIATAKSLGLTKIGDVTVQPDNEQTRGKIAQIGYLLKVEENN